jgi:DNA topoisomerase-3
MKIDFTGLQPIGAAPAKFGAGAEIYETPQSYVIRLVANGEDKVLVRCSRRILARDIPREQFMKMLETGKTDLLEKFWSQRTRRPFNAFLVLKPDNTTGFEFAPRAPKDPNAPKKGRGKRKAAAPADSAPPPPAAAG